MPRVVILGCGYVGQVLARRLIDRGNPVRATTTTEAKLTKLVALGAEPVLLRPDQPDSFREAMLLADAVVHLAPPSTKRSCEEEVALIRAACGPSLKAYVYGSSTGAFGRYSAEDWLDESVPPREPGERGRRRLAYERALREAGLPLRVVRIAGIYGPGRTLREPLTKGSLILFEGGPATSRIHVEDLVRLLMAMLDEGVPPLAIGCDDEPAPTLDVARYTCELLKAPLPEVISLDDAARIMSPQALEMRLGGRRCRSLVRESLMGPLRYPTYREGVVASLEAEGVLPQEGRH